MELPGRRSFLDEGMETVAPLRSQQALGKPVRGCCTGRDPVPRDSDREMMAAFLRKEPVAAGALYDRYASRIYGLGLVLLRNKTDAEDLVQDTFLRALRRGSAYDPQRGSLDTWMLLIARSLAIDLIRWRTLETRILTSEAGQSEASDEPGPEQYAEHRDLMDHARAAMDRLPPRQRSAVQLAYLGQRSSTQVAELEGVPRGTVKSRIRQGIISLREAMSEGEAS